MADFTIADVLAWARTKPADERYDFIKADVCALGQFAREMLGVSRDDAACGDYERGIPPELLRAANSDDAGCTFGAFVMRLEALAPETVVTKSNWAAIDAYLLVDA